MPRKKVSDLDQQQNTLTDNNVVLIYAVTLITETADEHNKLAL